MGGTGKLGDGGRIPRKNSRDQSTDNQGAGLRIGDGG